jgi:acetyl-CoA acetyltransferase
VAIKHELINKASDLAQELRAGLQGRVITPDDPEYDPARIVFDGAVDWHPALIARPVNAADVAHIVTLARQHGLELAIRSGGHGGFGHNLSVNGLVLDLREMRALEIDPVEGTAWAETGLTAGEFTQAVGAHGLATGFGDTGSVGIGGITLGGGIGFLVRKYGLTIDSLLAAEVVTADGQLLYTDAGSHPDLFWALRGGGGNFGVATRFKFRLHPVDAIVGGHLVLPATPEILAAYMAAAEAAPEELSSIANVMPAPPLPFLPAEVHGRLVLWAMMVYVGEQAVGEHALAPFRALAEPLADLLRPMRYSEMYEPEEGDYHPTAVARTLFLERCELDDARTIFDYLHASDAGMRVAQLRPLMRTVYALSGGVSKFAKARPDKTFQAVVKEAYDAAITDLGLDFVTFNRIVDGSVVSYFSDHFARQLMAGIMAQDYLGLTPKPSHRVEGGGATGGICFQEAWKSVASGHMDVCVAYGFETMSHVETWKGNEFIALASDASFDYPVGGFYSGYYAMMVTRHMHEFGTTVEQMAAVSVKNHLNATHNPYAQKRSRYTLQDIRSAPMVAWPLTRLDICVMSDGAAATILASAEGLRKLEAAGAVIPRPLVKITGIGRGTDAMRMADRPHVDYATFMEMYATPQERDSAETGVLP